MLGFFIHIVYQIVGILLRINLEMSKGVSCLLKINFNFNSNTEDLFIKHLLWNRLNECVKRLNLNIS